MKFFVGVTDYEWFQFLSERQPDEVNFWRPSNAPFRALQSGEPFLFKLRSPYNAITGGGFFVRYAALPLSIVWDAFQEKNGAPNYTTFAAKIRQYQRDQSSPDPLIGCIVLTQPFFFAQDAWIPLPSDWHANIVQGKSYNTTEPSGAMLWTAVQARLQEQVSRGEKTSYQRGQGLLTVGETRYGSEYLTRSRLGQGAFRILVTEAYQRRCAVTGERTLPILQAAHIQPYGQGGPHQVPNGLLLRADIHILFDLGYVTVTNDLHIEVSPRIKRDYGNGRDYYTLHGKPLTVIPSQENEQPASEFLEWHNQHIYVA
jgi:putative restriction endonuclease